MGLDLSFWKYKEGTYLNNQSTYEKCSNGENVEGLENLPVESIISDVKKEFPNWKILAGDKNFESPGNKGAFEIFASPQFVRFDCYGMGQDDLNRIIDIMLEYDCPLYDSQISERFDGR